MPGQRAKAELLRRLHDEPELLVLVNVWDVASARVLAALPGCRAIATASWSIAAAHGYPDGERMPLAEMVAAIGRIARSVDLPVTVDLERGYGADPAAVAESAAQAIEAGAAGFNLEDGTGDRDEPLRPADEHAARVAAVRERGAAADVPVVINARTDVYLAGAGAAPDRLGEAVARGRAYLVAGADCVFVPGVRDEETIGRLAEALERRLSVLATSDSPPLARLRELGVARVSFGPGPLGIALAALERAAATLLAGGAYSGDLRYRPPAP
ncbi:MAG: isocitrate lyase/PEP mutase family protein [Gaiellaceae bacterium]